MSTIQNNVQLIGHLGDDPEEVKLDNNKKLAKFSLATNLRYKNKEGDTVENTQWHRIVAWDKLADICINTLKREAMWHATGDWCIETMKLNREKNAIAQKFIWTKC